MRFVVIAAVGFALTYSGAGLVVCFGLVIMVTLGFLMNDIQDQTKQLTVILKNHGELKGDEGEKRFADLQSTVETLRRELLVMAKAQHAMHAELRTVAAVVIPRQKGPWEA